MQYLNLISFRTAQMIMNGSNMYSPYIPVTKHEGGIYYDEYSYGLCQA